MSFSAQAQTDDATRAAARSLGTTGVEAYQAGNYSAAHDKLERAYQILKVPTLGLWSARTLVKLDKLVEGGERYLEVTRLAIQGGDVALQKQAQADAQSELDALTPRVPNLIVQVDGADVASVSIKLDGLPLSSALIGEKRPVDPGAHHVEGTRGTEHVTVDVTVSAESSVPALLHFTSTAEPSAPVTAAPSTSPAVTDSANPSTHSVLPTVGWAAIGVGGAGILVGGIAGVIALGKHSTLESDAQCSSLKCQPSESSSVSSYNSMRTVSSIGFIAGGVLAGTGVVLLLSSRHESPSTALLLSPSSVFLRRQF